MTEHDPVYTTWICTNCGNVNTVGVINCKTCHSNGPVLFGDDKCADCPHKVIYPEIFE